ncbi:MAG: HAD-IA family hydrolase [Pseudomonadota bacterium]
MTLALALFDVDGTLVDSQAHIVGSMEAAFEGQGLTPPTRSDILGIVGLSLPQAMQVLAPEADAPALVAAYKQSYQDLRSSHGERSASPLYDGIAEVLAALDGRSDLVMGVATGKSRRGLNHVMEVHGLAHRFVTRQDADGHPSKPHPSMALTAMAEAGADRGVMIGDTTFDLEMGRAAGLATLGVTWGYHPVARLRPHADAIVNDPSELAAAILRRLELSDE